MFTDHDKDRVRNAVRDAKDKGKLTVVKAVTGVPESELKTIASGGDVDITTWLTLSMHLR